MNKNAKFCIRILDPVATGKNIVKCTGILLSNDESESQRNGVRRQVNRCLKASLEVADQKYCFQILFQALCVSTIIGLV